MISFFHFFSQKLRLSNPWRYKVPLILAFTYFLLLVGDVNSLSPTFSFLAAIATTIGFMGFGYLTNDLADRKKDALAGKSNGTSNLSSISVVLLLTTFLAMALLPWMYLPMDWISWLCIIIELVLFVLYAFPPFRLKERGFLGVITDALYAHVVPGFLASWTFYLFGNEHYRNFLIFAIALTVWQLFSGVRNILSHHYADFENDQASGTRTYATGIGKEKVYRLMTRMFIPLEVISLSVFLFVVQLKIDYLVIVVLLFLIVAWSNFKKDTGESRAKHFTNTFLDRFYIHWFPYILLFSIAFGAYDYWWMLVIHFLIFHPFIGKFLRRITTNQAVNHRVKSEETPPFTIAILSTNPDKYSETFIHAHFQLLPRVVIYSNGYFPSTFSLDKGKSWEELERNLDPETALIQSWKTNNVKAILAEYGPAGVEVMKACEKAKLPLIVHFHGFDAYRDDVIESYGERYVELFQKASKIVVVSKDMFAQLVKLGCPKEKIQQITYGVDTDLLCPSNDDQTRENFIACGRFVPKKSPLTTIRAFAKVVEAHPGAKLTFIGDGELLDDAISLAKELNLQENIDFKGVLNPSEVAAELQKHAIFVQHSIRTEQNDSEGTPLSILEAAATGLAIVATKHGGISDVIETGVTGYLVEEGDVEAMANYMLELYNNKPLRSEFGDRVRTKILNEYKQADYIDSLEKCLLKAELTPQKESQLSIWKTRLIVFAVLFLIAEIGLRFVGYKPGVIEEFYYHRGPVVYDSLLYGDEVGITHAVDGQALMLKGGVNAEGFFSSVEYTPASMALIRSSGKKIVMLIGDSYTQGCCADSYDLSFAQLLNQSSEYEVLNFGIAGADPVQYRLIVEKYAPILKPDLIVVAVYGGNDIMEYDRTPKPFVPLSYPIKNGPWLNSEGPIYLTKQGAYFKNFNEAKAHYFEYFSLWSDDASFFEKMIRHSIILSRPYMKYKTKRRFEEIKDQMPVKLDKMPYSKQNLEALSKNAALQNIPVQFVLIPSPSDVLNHVDLRKKYDFVFGKNPYTVPSTLNISDYDGAADGNHFNNQGHQKYSGFLGKLIELRLKK
jgi:glycosyltransferase involved in cell wall biosynthesis/lysophospholipase L1-like esterase